MFKRGKTHFLQFSCHSFTSDCFGPSYLPPCFIIVQVHQGPGVLLRPPRVILLPLPGVNKLAGKPVAVVDVVAAAAPQPVAWQLAGPDGTATAAGGQLAFAARPADGVDHAGRADGVGECCFPRA